MKMTLKYDDKVVDIKEPLVTPFQNLNDKIRICLVYIPKNAYYWLIHDIVNKRRDYICVTLKDDPEKIDSIHNIENSSIYQLLRMSIVNNLNNSDIGDIKFDLNLGDNEPLTEDIFYKHIIYITGILYNEEENYINDLDNEVGEFKEIIVVGREFIQNENRKEIIHDLKVNYTKRKNIGKSNLDLSFILTDYLKIGKQYLTHLLYQLDTYSNGYNNINFDSIHEQINNIIGKNLINSKDLETSLNHMVANLKPVYNMIKFNNGILDFNDFELIEPEEPIFTVLSIDYNYKKNDYPTITNFLETSLNQGNKEDTDKYILGFKEVIGYLFCSGNQDEITIFMVGVRGSGKSTTINLLSNIFGNDKISDLKPQDPAKNIHATAVLLGKHLNIAKDIDSKPVENIGIFKQMRGYDDIDVNPKGREIITIPKEEVPKNINVSNQMPIFKNIDDAFIETSLFIEFKHTFRGTNKENKAYVKGFDKSEIEGFIYDSIIAYKNKKINNQDFILHEDLEENKRKFEMHTKPVHYLVSELVRFDSSIPEEDGEDKIYVDELSKMCIELAKIKGLSITVNNNGNIDGRVMMKAIKENFNLYNWKDQSDRDYASLNDPKNNNKRYYPYLVKNSDFWDTFLE